MAEIHTLPGVAAGPSPKQPVPKRRKRRLPTWRSRYANEAAAEIEQIAAFLQVHCMDIEDGSILRGLGIRLEQLSNVVGRCDDEGETEESVTELLLGPAVKRARRGNGPFSRA